VSRARAAKPPAPKLGELLERVPELGDDAEVARILSAELGRPISEGAVRMRRNMRAPASWLEALGIELVSPPAPVGEGHGGDSELGPALPGASTDDAEPVRRDGPAPTAPDGARIAEEPRGGGGEPPATLLVGMARERVRQAYGLIGFGVSTAAGNAGIAKVVDDSAPAIADAWVQAAAEGNELARRVLSFMSAGGAMGELVTLHIVMLGGILYVTGRFPEVGLYGGYRGFRKPDRPASAAAAGGDGGTNAGQNGAGNGGAPGPVAGATFPPRV